METQRTESWHQKRIGRITGSRAGAILGLSPWQTREGVMREMVRQYHGAESEFSGNIATSHGNANEDTAIRMFELETGLTVEETGFHEYEDWAGASPDGLTSDGGVLEVKVPFKGIRKTLSEQPQYMAQIQMEMLATGRKKAHFWQWQVDGKHTHEIVRSDEHWLSEAIPVLKEFHAEYLKELDNPIYLEPLRVEINTNRSKMLIDEYMQLKEAKENAEERLKEVQAEIVELTGGKNALIYGHKVTKVEKDGSVSYAKVVKQHLPDLDLGPFKGKPSEYWKIT